MQNASKLNSELVRLLERSSEREQILELLEHVTRGHLEERRVLIDMDDPLSEVSWGLNHLLDKVESFMRESSIAMKELAAGKKPRGIDPRGYQGTFLETLSYFNKELEESYRRKQQVHNMLDNLGQAFMVCDREGRIDDGFSKATEEFFGQDPKGKTLMDLLQLSGTARASVLDWLNMTFVEMIPFDSIVELGPKSFEKTDGLYVELKYRAIRDEDQKIKGLIVIGTDKTYERQLKAKAEAEAAFVKTVMMVMSDRETFIDFINETRHFFSWMEEQLTLPPEKFDTPNCFRLMHSLKGGSAAFGLIEVQKLAHASEHRLSELKDAGSIEALRDILPSLKDDLAQLRSSFEGFLKKNEAVIGRFDSTTESQTRVMPIRDILETAHELEEAIGKGSPILNAFRERFLLEGVDQFFGVYERLCSSVAQKLGKEVEFHVEPSEVRVFKGAYKALIGSMVHAFRNAVDHGIETPEERAAKGKSEAGSIRVSAHLVPGQPKRFRIIVADDGAGLNTARIGEIAVKRGLVEIDELAGLSAHQIHQFVPEAGFSTKDSVTDLSGRGVGLDAIRYEAQKLGGRVWVESESGKGSRLLIEVPLIIEP